MQTKCIVVTGQTATGKTSYALTLAKKINGVLINFDSRQIYKELSIITGKDIGQHDTFTPVEEFEGYTIGYYLVDGVQVWLYDIVHINQHFSAFIYAQLVERILSHHLDNKTPIFVGGTYLYLKQLLFGTDFPVGPNLALREKLEAKPVPYLQKYLMKIDLKVFESLNNSDQNNPHRLIRKIAIVSSGLSKHDKTPLVSPIIIIGFKHKTDELLHSRIRDRVEERFKNGAIDEVKNCITIGHILSDPGMNALGVKQVSSYIQNEINKDECIENWTTEEVKYARRQLTFMKQNKTIQWRTV